MTNTATLRPVHLNFQLGELTLFRARLNLMVRSLGFEEFVHPAGDLEEPVLDADRKIQGTLVRSQPIDEQPPRISRFGHTLRYVPSLYQRYYIDLGGTFEDYLQSFSSKSRSTLRRKVRKFAEHSGGECDWREYRTAEEFGEFYDLARTVSRLTYQERLLDAGLPESEGFRRKMLKSAGQGNVLGYVLFHDGKPVAYLYLPIQNGVVLYQFLGYDPAYSKWSVGTVLQYFALERLFAEEGATYFDFTEGEGSHKRFFATGSRFCGDVYYLRPCLRNRLLVAMHSGLDGFSDRLVGMLDKLGLKSRIKNLLRRVT